MDTHDANDESRRPPAGAPPRLGSRAVVVGASIAGLLAARVLADHFDRVDLVERDEIGPYGQYRRGVQQARHTHGLLAGGLQAMEELLPGLTAELVERGAVPGDTGLRVAYDTEGWTLAPAETGLVGVATSRLLVEDAVRRRVLALPAVALHQGCSAVELCLDPAGRVAGLRVSRDDEVGTLAADLVVDASGRGSRAPVWLESLGFGRPRIDEVVVGLTYTTREFARTGDPGAAVGVISAGSRSNPRCGVLLAQPDDRWIVTLGGYLGEAAPTDLEGFRRYAASLDAPHLAAALDGLTPVGESRTFKYHGSAWRRYDLMRRLPEGFVVLGDAMCSFNPIYGQGMSVAAREALALRRCLQSGGLRRLGRRFHRAAAREIRPVWKIAVGSDLRLPAVKGRRTVDTRLSNWYLARYYRAASGDPALTARFVAVVNLVARPESLLHPGAVARVVRGRHNRRGVAAARPVPEPAGSR